MRADNSHHLTAAARRRAEQTLDRAQAALERAEATGEVVSVSRFAESAGVSRAWLYAQPELRERVERLQRGRAPDRPPVQQRASAASQQQRLQLAHERITELQRENTHLREQLARLLGQQRTANRPAHA